MPLRSVALVALASSAAAQDSGAPCVPLTANFDVTASVKICPGVYAFDDPEGDGVIRVRASDVTIEMEGVTLNGSQMQGYGIVADGFDGVAVRHGAIHGFRAG